MVVESVSGKRATHLVVDAVGFLKNAPLQEFAEKIYTIPSVVKEIRDRPTRRRLQVLPYELIFREPSQESLRVVTEVSKRTGDYRTLSLTDMHVLALTYQLEKEVRGGDAHLNFHPQPPSATKVNEDSLARVDSSLPGFYNPRDSQQGVGEENTVEAATRSPEALIGRLTIEEEVREVEENSSGTPADRSQLVSRPASNPVSDSPEPVSVDSSPTRSDRGLEVSEHSDANPEGDDDNHDDDDDDEGWITPANISQLKSQEDVVTHADVACITADFAMQNVLIQMGLHVLSVEGRVIREARTYIYRCIGCFHTTPDMTKVFCPHCGNKTLKRVSVAIQQDGSRHMFINYNRPINLRGTKFSLPSPKGGKHAVNPILAVDQRVPQMRASKMSRRRTNPLDPDYIAGVSPFAVNDVYSRAAQHGYLPTTKKLPYWARRNPNAVSRT